MAAILDKLVAAGDTSDMYTKQCKKKKQGKKAGTPVKALSQEYVYLNKCIDKTVIERKHKQ